MKRGLNFYELTWIMFLYLTLTDFLWVYLIITVLTFPGYVAIYDNAQAQAAAKQAHKDTLEEIGMNDDGSEVEQ